MCNNQQLTLDVDLPIISTSSTEGNLQSSSRVVRLSWKSLWLQIEIKITITPSPAYYLFSSTSQGQSKAYSSFTLSNLDLLLSLMNSRLAPIRLPLFFRLYTQIPRCFTDTYLPLNRVSILLWKFSFLRVSTKKRKSTLLVLFSNGDPNYENILWLIE